MTNKIEIQNKVQTEDFMHDLIALLLPHINKSDIRPAFQTTKKNNPTGRNFISQNGETSGLVGFTNTDNFIYFKVVCDPNNDSQSEVEADDTASFIRTIELTVYIYGEQSQNNALILKSLMRTTRAQSYINLNGYYQLNEGDIKYVPEDINGEWWDRYDVTFHFNTRVVITPANEDRVETAIGYESGDTPRIRINGGNENAN
ncbi:MAG: hypothetical protein RR342_01110 [Bacilli bacterium]